jgi:hypothetical protein
MPTVVFQAELEKGRLPIAAAPAARMLFGIASAILRFNWHDLLESVPVQKIRAQALERLRVNLVVDRPKNLALHRISEILRPAEHHGGEI